jgi:hypothetical protein
LKIERLTPGEIVSAVAGLTLVGLMSGVWFEHPTASDIASDAIGYQTAPDAWQAFAVIDIVLLVTAVCAVSAAIVTAAGSKVRLPLRAAAVVTLLGLISMVLLAYRIADPIEAAGIGFRRDLPLFLGFGMCGLIAGGGVMTMLAEGTTLGDELSGAAAGRPRSGQSVRPRQEPSAAAESSGAASGAGHSGRRSLPRPSRRKR